MLNLIFLGPPGAGKGTHAKVICDMLQIAHISTGDLLRANIKDGTQLGIEAAKYMNGGNLVPDELVIGMLLEKIRQPECANGFVLDGFPRTIPQAEHLEKSVTVNAVLNIDVPDESIMRRICGRRTCGTCGHITNIAWSNGEVCEKCGGQLTQRADDNPETVAQRLKAYHAQTEPLIDFYKARDLLVTVDGSRPVEAVQKDIEDVLKAIQ